MAIFKKSQKRINESLRSKRFGSKNSEDTNLKSRRSQLFDILIYTLFAIAVVLICFAGLSPAGPLVQENQVSRIRIVTEIPFTYHSKIETEEKLESQRQQIPPVFKIEKVHYITFKSHLEKLVADLIKYAEVPDNASQDWYEVRAGEVETFLKNTIPRNPYKLRATDLTILYNQLGADRLNEVISESLLLLGDIYNQGFYSEQNALIDQNKNFLSFFNIEDESGAIAETRVLSEEEALRSLRVNLSALDIPREAQGALVRTMRSGLTPNLKFDKERTQALIEQAQNELEPVTISVRAGDTIVEPNTRVTKKQYEQLEAYRKALELNQNLEFGFSEILIERMLLTFFIVSGAAFYLRTSRIRFRTNHRVFLLSGILILFNLLIMRGILEFADSSIGEINPLFIQVLPFLLPVVLGPIILTILVGFGPGILAAAVIGVLNGMMQGNSLAMMIVTIIAGLIGIHACQNIQLRTRLVRAGSISSIAMVLGAIFFGIRDSTEISIIIIQCIASVGIGVFSGIVVVGLLPILEKLFKYTTDITLLEMTDFNHPLLRKMQVEAPGSYHHSLMVANLSENAAAAIGANPLVCRVCALFHDIGKMVKPEYFSENQRTGYNPHIERNPSMSALVIKSHVKEGVQMAKQYKLPRLIIDVIRQHHGTSLIQYFYYKALEQQKAQGIAETVIPNAPRIELDKVNEDTYRYEGPVPQFTESAIIMLADSIEAASRSLRKVSPQSIGELLDKIFQARMEDGQLDATPITFLQLAKIKESFSFTLLNMLHARVEYPEEASQSEKQAKKSLAKKNQNKAPEITQAKDEDKENAEEKVKGKSSDTIDDRS